MISRELLTLPLAPALAVAQHMSLHAHASLAFCLLMMCAVHFIVVSEDSVGHPCAVAVVV